MSDVVQKQDVVSGDALDLPVITTKVAFNTEGEMTGGNSSLIEEIENVAPIEEVENSLKRLEISHNKEINPKLLSLKLEEINVSNSQECPPVVLIGGDKHEIRPFRNKYTIHGRYLYPAKVNKWVIVVLFDERIVLDVEKGFKLFEDIHDFADRYAEFGRSKGISIGRIDTIQYVPSSPSHSHTVATMSKEELKSELRELLDKLNDNLIDHALIILPENCPFWVHGYLQYLETNVLEITKKRGATKQTTRTSRMKYETLKKLGIQSRDRGKTSLIPHIWLKYNTKLGGVNVALKHTFDTHDLKFLNEGTLILSIDLCKLAQAVEDEIGSTFKGMDIAASVGMWDLAGKISFRSQTRAQMRNMAVVDIDLLVRDIILSYKQRKGDKLPTNIIIFRSVTYQNRVEEVAQQELTSIKKMLEAEWKKSEKDLPSITYLRVPKREKVSKSDQMRSSNLIQTGSLVDSIMSGEATAKHSPVKDETDGFDSTLKPFTYHGIVLMVYDENNLSARSVRAMVHSLSYLSPRTTSKTRPTPIDLADLANERTRHISFGWLEDNRDKYKDDKGQMMSDLNRYLTEDMGDDEYRNTLYYA